MQQLIGPFSQILTFGQTPVKGPLSTEQINIIHQGAVLFEDGIILKVGNFEELSKSPIAVHEIQGDHVLLPGLIDCHTHMVWSGSRAADFERRNSGYTYQQILAEGGGILDTVGWVRKSSAENLKMLLQGRVNRHLEDGITTIEVKSGYGLDEANELKMLEVIHQVNVDTKADLVSTFLGAHVCPKEFHKKEYLHYLLNEVAPKAKQWTHRADAFVEAEAFSVALARPYLEELIKMGFELTLHADQFSRGGSVLAVDLNARSADHLEATTTEDMLHLAQSNTVAVALPGASLGLGMPFTPARKLLDAGAILAIATDWNPGSAPGGDLVGQSSILAAREKLTAAEALSAITFRAALALGVTDRGRLIPGNLIDAAAFPTHDFREILYQQGHLKPDLVWKKGALLSSNGVNTKSNFKF